MIRPFTFVTLMLACSSGAYLFVIKHRAAGLDEQISGITGQIRSAEQRIRVLQAEWAQENDPNQLTALAGRFTNLKPMAPDQLTSLASLADSLPAPGADIPHLPLPPPPPWAKPATPATSVPVADGGPVASAGQVRPAAAILAGGHRSAVTETALLAPALPAPKPINPVKPAQIAARGAVHHPARRVAPSHGGFEYAASSPARVPVMAATASPAQTRMAPRYAAVLPYRSPAPVQSYRYQHEAASSAAGGQSVFGSLGSDLPPPQPVYRSPR